MHSFTELSKSFESWFSQRQFPATPAALYDAASYLPLLGGKRVRPVLCLMANELFGTIDENTWHVGAAIEMFHNFTLVHDDIMDKAPLRRGKETVHMKFGESTALLAGDVMLVKCYEHLEKLPSPLLNRILRIFNQTAAEVCEGQQMDMDFEQSTGNIQLDDYIRMIGLKTSVLLAAALKMGAVMGGAGLGNQQHLYEFGKNLGIAFQVQDDYLDAFGNPEKFGKQPGGDIIAGKKTFLTIHTIETASPTQKKRMEELMLPETNPQQRVEGVLEVFKACGVDEWALQLKQQYFNEAMKHFEAVAVTAIRKKPLEELAGFLMGRDH
jgi:geranylgeranyl diphosphate synthase, type II